jgi:hypothetical protein
MTTRVLSRPLVGLLLPWLCMLLATTVARADELPPVPASTLPEETAPARAEANAPPRAPQPEDVDDDDEDDDDLPTLRVSAPLLELTAGPGRGYPALHALEQGDGVHVVKRKTDWFKLEAENGASGWVHRDVVLRSVQGAGYVSPTLDDFGARRFELGMMSGDFDGAATIGVFGAYSLSPNVALKLGGQKILGNFSDGWIAAADIVIQPFADWRIAPYFTLGGGAVHVEPQTTLIASQDRTDEMAHVGIGLRFYLARRFVLRAEYETYQVFTSRNENEEIRQWQVGVSAFF